MSSLVYFGSMQIGRPNGPGVNEYDFIDDLIYTKLFDDVNIYGPMTTSAFEKFSGRVRIVKVTRYPIIRELSALIKLVQDCFVGRLAPSLVVIRLGQLPIFHWILIKLMATMSIPVHVKTVGVGTANKKKGLKVTGWLNFLLIRKIVCTCTSLDTPTYYAKNRLVEVFVLELNKIIIVHNGSTIFDVHETVVSKKETIVLGYIVRFPQVRGGKQVIQVLSHCRNIGLKVEAIITGDESEVTLLRKLAESLNVADIVRFIGVVDKNEIPKILSNIDFGFSIVEGIRGTSGQKLRQYLMAGCNVIYSNDEFFESVDEEFVHEYKSVEDTVQFVNQRYSVNDQVRRPNIREWAIENISYTKMNKVRLTHLKDLEKLKWRSEK